MTRPKVWLHTTLPSETNATDAEVDLVSFSACRTALRPSLIVVLNVGGGCFFAGAAAWAAGTPPSAIAGTSVAVRTVTMRMAPDLSCHARPRCNELTVDDRGRGCRTSGALLDLSAPKSMTRP